MRINEVYLQIKYPPTPIPGISVKLWHVFYEPLSKSIPLTPDGYLELETTTGIKPIFLEVDLGTEALRIWETKVKLYVQLAVTGEFQKLFSHEQFRVFIVLPTEKRVGTVRSVIAKVTDKIFWLTSFELIKREGFWSPIWSRPTGDQKQSLV